MKDRRPDRKIDLQRKTSTQDEHGSPVDVWSSIVPGGVWAKKVDASDSELLRGGEVAASISTRFTIRYDSAWADLSPLDRVVHEGKVHDVVGVKEPDDGTRRQWMEISCSARAETPPA